VVQLLRDCDARTHDHRAWASLLPPVHHQLTVHRSWRPPPVPLTRRLHSQPENRWSRRRSAATTCVRATPAAVRGVLRRTLILGLSTGYRLTWIAPARLARDRSPSAALSEKMQAQVTFGGIGLRPSAKLRSVSEIDLPRLISAAPERICARVNRSSYTLDLTQA
jgi:hypothetical protein